MMMFWILMACGEKSTTDSAVDADTSTESAFVADSALYYFENAMGETSVSYTGQTYRHLLIYDVKATIDGLDTRLQSTVAVPGDITADLMFYLVDIKDIDVSMAPHQFSTGDLGLQQVYYGDVSSGKNLFEKLAGNDTVTDHKDWQVDFVGWDHERVTSPESLVRLWVDELDAQAVNWTVLSTQLAHVYVSPDGLDYGQLIQKFLLGAVAFSQGVDDYLDDDVEGKGLLASHVPADGEAYSALEHAWDEGFGYFGASQDYVSWTDEALNDTAYLDRNGDGQVDIKTEVSWGHSRNAAKRDLTAMSATDFSSDAWDAFWKGRALLHDTVGTTLSEAQLEELRGYRNQAVLAWEMAIVATIVHYINATIQDIQTEATLADLAKHWSEMKGFALSLQFNPHSTLSDTDFIELHRMMGTQPNANSDYVEALLEARTLLGSVYGMDSENLGDRNGENGW